MHCPICGKKVDDFATCDTDKPFTAFDPIEGLNAWSAYDVPKRVLCYNGGATVHFETPNGLT